MKTYHEWEESGKNWTEFFQPLDEIDEEAFLHILEIVPPQFIHNSTYGYFGQNGEAHANEAGITFRDTVWQSPEGKYYHLGLMPQFRKWKERP